MAKTEPKFYSANVIAVLENGDAVLELPEQMLQELGWKEDDVLDISKKKDGSIVMVKLETNHDLKKVTTKQAIHSIKNYPFSREGTVYHCTICDKYWKREKDAKLDKCVPKD
jgi:bifunctional DNA-binding transcriptional regulator/antitoxin component of YhaV-PrlF toxin-antitoxin module